MLPGRRKYFNMLALNSNFESSADLARPLVVNSRLSLLPNQDKVASSEVGEGCGSGEVVGPNPEADHVRAKPGGFTESSRMRARVLVHTCGQQTMTQGLDNVLIRETLEMPVDLEKCT